jgi:2-polyprenyl-6-methoxyphenol hydroxylase-like FAD-dependent oxidoreductase
LESPYKSPGLFDLLVSFVLTLCFCSSILSTTHSLGQIKMKIIIVGGGISGLSTYLFLKKYLSELPSTTSIKIYEKHLSQAKISTKPGGNDSGEEGATFEELSSSTAIVGGGLGVSPNGMRLLKELGQELHDAVVKEGSPCDDFVFRSSRGWRLHSSSSGDRRVEDGEEVCVAISRHKLWECLHNWVCSDSGEVVEYKRVIEARIGVDGKKPCVIFEDGSVEEADLVIGGDGVRSVIKKGIFGVNKVGTEEFAPVYEYVHSLVRSLTQHGDADSG